MSGPTHKLDVVAQRIETLIAAGKAINTPQIDALFYGDQDKLPAGRVVCVEPVTVIRQRAGISDMVQNNFTVSILIYLVKYEEVQTLRQECNQLAEAIENLLHAQLQLDDGVNGPLVIDGFVSENLSGYSPKMGQLIRASRLTWEGKTKTSLRFGP